MTIARFNPPIAPAGTPIVRWEDASGNGRALSQTDPADRPTRGVMSNGMAAIACTGNEEWLFTNTAPLAAMGNVAADLSAVISFLVEFDSFTGTQTILGWTNSGSAFDEFWIGVNASRDLRIFRELPGSISDTLDSEAVFTEAGRPYLVTVAFADGLASAWVNGLRIMSGRAFATDTPVIAANRFVVGARDQSTNTQGLEGKLAFLEITTGDPVAIHGAHLEAMLPGEVKSVIAMVGIGQSMVAGATPIPNPIPFTCNPGVAWAIDQRPGTYGSLVGPFGNGNPPAPHFGQSAGWPHMAQRLFDLTGLRSVWSCFAIAGTGLVPETNPVAVNYWSPRDMSKCLAGDYIHTDGNETIARRQMIHDFFAGIAQNPGLKVAKRAVFMRHGHQDAQAGIANNRITAADYQREMGLLFDYMKAEFAIDIFLIDELGREGNDAPTVAANEPDYAPIRAAQNAVVAARSDTFMMFTGAKQTGPLVVDANGYHVSGWDLQLLNPNNQPDNVHDTAESHRAMGLTWARAAANIL